MQKNKIIAAEQKLTIPPFLQKQLEQLEKGLNIFDAENREDTINDLLFLKDSAPDNWGNYVKLIMGSIKKNKSLDLEIETNRNALKSINSCLLNLRNDNRQNVLDRLKRDFNKLKFEPETVLIKHEGYLAKELLDAIQKNNLAKVQELIGCGADINIYVNESSPLAKAIENKFITIALEIIKNKNFKVNEIISKSKTPLILATYYGMTDIVDVLLKVKGIDINIQEIDGSSALSWACFYGHNDIVKKLMDCNCLNPNVKLRNNDSLIIWAARHRDAADIARKALALNKIDVNAVDQDGQTAISTAAYWGYEDVAKAILTAPGLDLSIKDKFGKTAMDYAASRPEIKAMLEAYDKQKQ